MKVDQDIAQVSDKDSSSSEESESESELFAYGSRKKLTYKDHKRVGHLGSSFLRPGPGGSGPLRCPECLTHKAKRLKHKKSKDPKYVPESKGDRVIIDLCGPINPP